MTVDEVTGIEGHAQAWHVATQRGGRFGVLRHPPRLGLHAHHDAEAGGDRHHLPQPLDLPVEGRPQLRRIDHQGHHPERLGEPAAGQEAIVELRRLGSREGHGHGPQPLQIAAGRDRGLGVGRDLRRLEVAALLVHVELHRGELEFRQPLHRLGERQVGKTFRADTDEHVAGLLTGTVQSEREAGQGSRSRLGVATARRRPESRRTLGGESAPMPPAPQEPRRWTSNATSRRPA